MKLTVGNLKDFRIHPRGAGKPLSRLRRDESREGQNVEREYITEESHSESWKFNKVVLTITRIEQNFTSK